MKISKLFHWCYAFLMLYPIFIFFGSLVVTAFNPNIVPSSSVEWGAWSYITDACLVGYDSQGLIGSIYDAYYYVCDNVFGPIANGIGELICTLLTHWTIVSVIYICFDVLMYLPLLFHSWIDKWRIE